MSEIILSVLYKCNNNKNKMIALNSYVANSISYLHCFDYKGGGGGVTPAPARPLP